MNSEIFLKTFIVFKQPVVKYISVFLLISALIPDTYAGNFTVNDITQFRAALNTAAANGESDTINVLAGIYNVNPAVSFSSGENFLILIRGTGSPVFDGGNSVRILQVITQSAGGDVFIEGLTFRNGHADYGGGLNVLTQGADISINNCTFNDNAAGFVGGGANLFSNTGNVTVTNCSFSRNSSPNTSGYPYGTAGGLFIQTDGSGTVITLTTCSFGLNTAQRDAAGAMLYPLGNNSAVIAASNTFSNNTAKEYGGGCWIRGPGGNTAVIYRNNFLTGNSSSVAGSCGGTYIQIASGSINLYDNILTGNYAVWQGGGLWIEHSGGILNIYRNRFTNNNSAEFGSGANIFLDNGTAKLYQNIFNKNRTSGPGGGINISTATGILNIINNTFYFNNASDGGDVNIYFDNSGSAAHFYNNILYKSALPALTYSGQQTLIARYSNIQGGTGEPWFGTGCIDLYPFFSDTAGNDFHLQDSVNCCSLRYSPCIDAGNPSVQDSILHCDWGLGTARSDMGAYGGNFVSIGIIKINTNIPEEYYLYQNYPNPFNPGTNIKYQIPNSNNVKLVIYSSEGKQITELVNQKQTSGTYAADWNASGYSSGIYIFQLIINDSITVTKRMVIVM